MFESFIAVTARACLAHRAFNGNGSVAAFRAEVENNMDKYQKKSDDPGERAKIGEYGLRAIAIAERDNAVTMTCITG